MTLEEYYYVSQIAAVFAIFGSLIFVTPLLLTSSGRGAGGEGGKPSETLKPGFTVNRARRLDFTVHEQLSTRACAARPPSPPTPLPPEMGRRGAIRMRTLS